MNFATNQPPAASRRHLVLPALALLVLWFVLCRHLSGEWAINEQYSYGWFVPFFAAFLFWLRWEDRPEADRGHRTGIAIGIAILALVVLFPVRLFEVANPDWRPLGWMHALAVIAITFVVLYFAGGWGWVKHFSFPVFFFLVAVPWISPIEQPIVQGLMRVAAAVATEAITLCGIPAQLEGSLIRVSTGIVGVNEACSGVRSLQTSLMIGLLFGELKRFAVGRRIALVVGAVTLALLANFGRAFWLVWIAATRGIAAVGEWHDLAGYAIVAVVFLGSIVLTKVLKRDGKVRIKKEELRKAEDTNALTSDLRPPASRRLPLPASYILLPLLWLIAIEVSVEAWYRAHEKDLVVKEGWTVRAPEKAPGFRELKIDEEVRQTLRFDEGREVAWKSDRLAAGVAQTTNYLFFFRWNPGAASVVRARAHRPDICLPSAGWTLLGDRGTKIYSGPGTIRIAARHVVFKQTQGTALAHTFFCLAEDRIHSNEARPDLELAEGIQPGWSLAARTRVVRNGIRNLGQQVLEAIAINATPVGDAEAEARFGELLREVVVESRK